MLRCASSFVIAAYAKVRRIPLDSRALPAAFLRRRSFTWWTSGCARGKRKEKTGFVVNHRLPVRVAGGGEKGFAFS